MVLRRTNLARNGPFRPSAIAAEISVVGILNLLGKHVIGNGHVVDVVEGDNA